MDLRRTLTAVAAAAVMIGLMFVPSATAHAATQPRPLTATPAATPAATATTSPDDLADTGSIDTKPYLVGGGAFVAAGTGLVLLARRRGRLDDLDGYEGLDGLDPPDDLDS